MNESILSHIILCECLCFPQGKARPTNLTEKSNLSSLALVLNGNATCTAVYVHQADKIVLIGRNEPIKANDERYFDRFFREIRIYSNLCFDKSKEAIASEARAQLKSLMLEYNSKKIMNHLVGRNIMLIDQLRVMAQWNASEKTPFIEELQSNKKFYTDYPLITEKIYLVKGNYSEEDYVQFIFETLGEFLIARDQLIDNQTNPTDHHLKSVTRLAMILYQSRFFQYILDHTTGTADKGVYYFEKVSAHIRSLNLLLKCLLYGKDYLAEIYKNISWKLVVSVEERQLLYVTPKQAFQTIFINLSHSTNLNMSSEEFYNQYLQQMNKYENNHIHVVCLHAEILLIDYLIKNNINETNSSREVEIGISKMSCLLCSYYIDALNQKYNRYFCQWNSTDGKISSKWTYRNNEDPLIVNMINQKLISKIHQSIQKLCLQSDRIISKKSGDSDIMFTSMENDGFDEEEYRKEDP